jgi:NAD(P)-dependent dehydrogenase (short-subunit alcohol dehydrogenase family)
MSQNAMQARTLEGKTAIVTGASRGIGRAIALSLAREGANVAITGRTRSDLESVGHEISELGTSCCVLTADMTVELEVRQIAHQALSTYGCIDILVNNAGASHGRVDLVDFDFSEWRRILEVNLLSVAALCQSVVPNMIAQSGGKIINISSIGGKRPSRGQTAYKASKAALINFTGCLAAEVKEFGIDVNCICPGGVDTAMYRSLFGSPQATENEPMAAQAIADVAIFLASDKSAALTGTSIDAFGMSSPIFR